MDTAAQHSERDPPQSDLDLDRDLDRVTPFNAWCKRVGVSLATGRRLLASKKGPPLTRLSDRRIGIRERDHVAWLDARREAAA
jgi:hypothetical protein